MSDRTLYAIDRVIHDRVIEVVDYTLDRETGERFVRVLLDVDGPLRTELPLAAFEAVAA